MSEMLRQAHTSAALVRPRIGFLGVGWIGRNRMQALIDSNLVQVAAIADESPDVAHAAAELAPHASVSESLDSLLEQDLDALVIATPSALHAEQCIAALESGMAVFCQKPLARNAAENAAVIDAARKHDCLLGIDLSYRHVNGMKRNRELIRNGEIGKVFGANLVFHNAYGPDKSWYYNFVQSGGGCVMDLGIHLVDLALWALNYPEIEHVTSRLFSGGEPVNGRQDLVEDYAIARIDLKDGATINLACSWHLPAGREAVIEATFYGTKGGLSLHNLNGSFYAFQTERFRGTTHEALEPVDDGWGGRAAVAWARQLSRGNHFDPEVEKIITVAKTLDRIYGR